VKNISILGCGWLGKPLGISLFEEGFFVKGSTTTEEKLAILEASNIEPYYVDISEFKEYDTFLDTDILIIAITSKDIDGFENLIQQIENSPIQKVIFISSTSVYPNTNGIVSENTTTKKTPLSEIEELFRQNRYFETTIIRFAGLVGGERHPGNWFKNGRTIPHPEGFVNMIHQDDCIRIIHEIINQNCWNETFNGCADHHPKRREFYINAKASLGLEIPGFDEHKVLEYKIISPKKLLEVLDYTFIHNDLLHL
jgi:nucleoside-diphosphate-sugar epimerase